MTKSKTKITSEQVRQLGNLAKLNMSASEEERLREELSSVLEYFEVIDQVRDNVAIDQLSEDAANLRPDEVKPSDPEGVLRGVPQRKGRFVKAPRVF
ncbi:MAG: Asp-tRNA(Asn)/Glu-tRNA(Gln) amidotransferase subunit GatC [Thaumarchaeota archaeon]|nr:Asp-tRNA(Asn)/Glu-tRNA(Gln) amidotransferase subunit GatC [Nitrososphaerota archaeon]